MNIYVVFVLGFLLSYVAQKKNKKICVVLLACLLGLFVGFRHPSVGVDTHIYSNMFTYLRRGYFSPNFEYGFSALSYVILLLTGGNINAPFVVYGLFTNALIISRLWSLRKDHDFSLSILLYMILFYPSSCNIMRQYVAIAIVFWGLKYLDKNLIIRFLICVLIATSIHISAAVSVVYIWLYMQENQVSATKDKAKIIVILMAPILAFVAFYVLSHYQSYFAIRNNNIGFFNFVRLFFVALSAGLSRRLFSKKNRQMPIANANQMVAYRDFAYNNIIVKSYIIAIGLYFLGYMNTTIMRVGLYFGMYEIQYISLVCKKGRGRQISAAMYAVFVLYSFIANILGGWSGLGNYMTFLQ